LAKGKVEYPPRSGRMNNVGFSKPVFLDIRVAPATLEPGLVVLVIRL